MDTPQEGSDAIVKHQHADAAPVAAPDLSADTSAPATAELRTTRVYDRMAPLYDWIDAPLDHMGGRRRRARTIGGATGDVLEVGVGTGRNFELYARGVRLTAIDVSERMLERARAQAARVSRSVDLRLASVERLPFASASFDTVTATCVFCSVDNPVRGLEEVRRVLKPGGQLRLLEHVRPRTFPLGVLADLLTPVTRGLLGPALNRDTEAAVAEAGLEIAQVRRRGVWREIVAIHPRFRANDIRL